MQYKPFAASTDLTYAEREVRVVDVGYLGKWLMHQQLLGQHAATWRGEQ
jgi:hypothetical protein